MKEESESMRLRFAFVVTALFAFLTVPRLLLHELWRDEAWQWLVLAESHSFRELFQASSEGGGSGYLFPIAAFLARLAWPSLRSLQLAHLAFAAAAAFVFARWAPLGRRERALFLLGYFPFYEYAVISRSYAAESLLVWLACLAMRCRRPALALGAALGLLCQTTVYGCILAPALACGWMADRWWRRREEALPSWKEAAGGLVLAASGAVAGMIQITPAPGTATLPWRLGWDSVHAAKVVTTPWRALVPLPTPGLHFWNSSLLDSWPVVHSVASVLVLGLAFALVWRSKAALAAFAVGTAGLLAFEYLYLFGAVRHHGTLWLLFAAAVWMAGGRGFREPPRSWRAQAFLALLVPHVGAGLYASWMDLRHPFSNGAAAASLIRRLGLDREPLLGHREPPAATVALYLDQPLYSPSRKLFVTHPTWGPTQKELKDPELRCAARELVRKVGRDVVLVINRELPPWEEIEAAGATEGSIVETEDYHLYRMLHDRLGPTTPAARCGGEPSGAAEPRVGYNPPPS